MRKLFRKMRISISNFPTIYGTNLAHEGYMEVGLNDILVNFRKMSCVKNVYRQKYFIAGY